MKYSYTVLSTLTKRTIIALSLICIPTLSQARDISFNWDAVSGTLSGYKIFYKTGESSLDPNDYNGTGATEGPSPILVNKDSTSVVLTELSPNEPYHFVLIAYNSGGDSAPTAPLSIDPIPVDVPTMTTMGYIAPPE